LQPQPARAIREWPRDSCLPWRGAPPGGGHGGTDDLGNLALACIDCNLHKGPNLSGIDPETGKVVELLNPRVKQWDDQFEWDGIYIYGSTDSGRATVKVLAMNSEDQLALRSLTRE
jgi:hypothetical protein